MSSIICGSLAFDTIMNFEGHFANQILPDQLHILNVSFLVPTLRRDFGGCAGNIAYALKLLGGNPIPVAALGVDGQSYLKHMQALGIDCQSIQTHENHYTAQAMIMTDLDNNQITAFHPGAMNEAHLNPIPNVPDIQVGIIAPDGRQAMLDHAKALADRHIPFIFDPGQGLPMFDKSDLEHFVDLATWITVNDYEAKMLSERLNQTSAEISQKVKGLIITLGAQGCEIWENAQRTHVPAVSAQAVLDPTGCGDAFRGALLYGLEKGWSLGQCAALGNQLGAIKIAHKGPQNYQLDGLKIS
jgi:adenosine kinase